MYNVLSTNFNTLVDEAFMRELRNQQFVGLKIGNRFINREGIGFNGLLSVRVYYEWYLRDQVRFCLNCDRRALSTQPFSRNTMMAK